MIQGTNTQPGSIVGNGVTATAGGTTTIVTVPAGRTWVGTIGCSSTAQNPPVTATGLLSCFVTFVGAGSVPPQNVPYCAAEVELEATVTGSLIGANGSATSTQGDVIVSAPTANAVTISLFVATAGVVTGFQCRGYAVGVLL